MYSTNIVGGAAKIGLVSGNELVSFPCPKCGAVCCDPVERVSRL